MNKAIQRAAEKWNEQYTSQRDSWRQLRQVKSRLSSRLANIPGFNGSVTDAIAYRLRHTRPGQGYDRAISGGCGVGKNEMYLLRCGLVTHFDLFEISEVAIKRGESIAKEWGVQDRVTFHLDDVFNCDTPEHYDLVYWGHSLHHMFDVNKAVELSKTMLKNGGIFSALEYVGPNRFQFSDANLSLVNRILETLPDRLFKNPDDPQKRLSRHRERVALERIIGDDPTESVDSENIIPAVQHHFPEAQITILSANIDRLVLGHILPNLSEDEDDTLINLILLLDDMAIDLGIYHDAFLLGCKQPAGVDDSQFNSHNTEAIPGAGSITRGRTAKEEFSSHQIQKTRFSQPQNPDTGVENYSKSLIAVPHTHQEQWQESHDLRPLHSKDQLFFLHIPKAAGTTLTAILSEQFEEEAICPFYYPRELLNVTPEQLSKYRFVRGHFHYEVMARLLPKTTRFVIVLRNPIDRFLSHVLYWQQNPEVIRAHPKFVKRFTETSLVQFVHLTDFPLNRAISNYQIKWIAATVNHWDTVQEWFNKFKEYKRNPPLDIALGKQRLAQFEVVGLVEHFQETLFLLSYHFGWPPLVDTKRLNVTANRPTQRDIAAETLEGIRQMNQLDLQLYAYAKQLFDNHFQQMTQDLLTHYGSRSQAHLSYPIPTDTMIELLKKHYSHISESV